MDATVFSEAFEIRCNLKRKKDNEYKFPRKMLLLMNSKRVGGSQAIVEKKEMKKLYGVR